ncbi:MAG: protein kinase [Planctomycetaceae bacterium]|nr:protein kinase [Planctomycetaceae bacterium]
MATFDRPKSTEKLPTDLLAVIRSSGILTDRQIGELGAKMLRGEYPVDPIALAERLVKDDVLTVYQARRFLSNKAHGLLVGRYIILDRIGSGSMGRVYKAHHQMMDRVVALKIIAPEIAMNEKVVARFQREMRLVGRLDHPNVVRAFDADQVNTVLYIVMEYVPGISLGERLKKGPIPAQQMFDYAAQAALGLAHAHDQGMVHRDIKPSNMLLTEDRKIKILDLGLGVLMEADTNATFATADGIAVGTVDYMSPEQALGKEVDGRSDLFSLGCAMFHLMTGKLAFPGDSPIDRLGGRISGRPVPITKYLPDLPASAVRVLDRMLAFRPEDRFSTAREAADALLSTIRPRTRPAGSSRPAQATAIRENAAEGRLPTSGEESPPGGSANTPTAPATAHRSASAPAVVPQLVAAAATSPVRDARHYPAWFRPLAAAAEHAPRRLLIGLVIILILVFGAGVGLGYFLR